MDNARKSIVRLIPGTTLRAVKANSPWHLEDAGAVSILWDIDRLDEWIEAVNEENSVLKMYVVTLKASSFRNVVKAAKETLDAVTTLQEVTIPANEGFLENLEYFRLDFLDPDEVARGDAFKAILPILWMVAGCCGEREESKGSGPGQATPRRWPVRRPHRSPRVRFPRRAASRRGKRRDRS